MQYNVQTPKEYLEIIEDDWRKQKLLILRSLILSLDTQLIEGIQYKMLSYSLLGKEIFHLNVQKNYIGLYVGEIKKIDPDLIFLQGFDMGKGCIRLKKSIDIQSSGLPKFIQKTIDLHRKGVDLDC